MTKPYVLTRAEQVFVEELVASGRYASVDEVVHEALERFFEEEVHVSASSLEDLRRAWQEGVASGDYRSADETLQRLDAKGGSTAEGRGA